MQPHKSEDGGGVLLRRRSKHIGQSGGCVIKGPPTARESPIAKRSGSALDMYLLSMRLFNEKDHLTLQIEAVSLHWDVPLNYPMLLCCFCALVL
jgi:hypothetical protein